MSKIPSTWFMNDPLQFFGRILFTLNEGIVLSKSHIHFVIQLKDLGYLIETNLRFWVDFRHHLHKDNYQYFQKGLLLYPWFLFLE